MKKLTILLAAAMCVSAAVAQDAPKYINSLSINYNNNTLYPKDADHLTLNGFGVNYNFDYRLSESVPVYLGTGVNLQFLFRSENLLDDDIIGELPSMRNIDITQKWQMFNLTIPINISYRVPVAANFYLTPIIGLDLKTQLYGKTRLDVDGPTGSIFEDEFGMVPNKDINLYDDDDMAGDAFNRFQLAWHAGLKFEYNTLFLQLTYGTDFTKLHKDLGEGTFQVGIGKTF